MQMEFAMPTGSEIAAFSGVVAMRSVDFALPFSALCDHCGCAMV